MIKYVLLVMLLAGCEGHNNLSEETVVLQAILNSSEFKNFHHPDLKNRIPLFLLDEERLFSDKELSEVNPKVVLVDDTTGTKGNYIQLSKLDIGDKKADVRLYYKIENVHMAGSLIKKEKSWQIDYIIET